MIKIVAGIIKQDDKVLFLRRGPLQTNAGQWEYPGGKVEQDERTAHALARELKQKLGIDVKKSKLATNIVNGGYELYAYYIESYDGNIELHEHDGIKWVPFLEAPFHDQLPADREVSIKITGLKTKKDTTKKLPYIPGLKEPYKDEFSHYWCVEYNNEKNKFLVREEAYNFYLRKIMERMSGQKIKNALTVPGYIR